MKQRLLLFTLSLFMMSCGDQKIDTTKARLEMEAREIKKVSEGEIVEKTMQLGNTQAAAFKLEQQVDGTYSFLSPNMQQTKAGFIAFDQISVYDGKRFQVFDAYAYNAENNITSEPGVQILEGDTVLLYTRPALIDGRAKGVFFIEFKRRDIVLSIDK